MAFARAVGPPPHACLSLPLAMARVSLIQEVRVLVLDDERRLYRACWAPDSPAQLDSFRSHYELQRPPRGAELRAAVIHMAVSMFETPAPCWDLIARTHGRIGDHVAELRLVPGRGVCVAKTGGPFTGPSGEGQMNCRQLLRGT